MGAFSSKKKQALEKLKKINKPTMPNSAHSPDQQFSFLISDPISRYIWDEKPESDILIKDLVESIRIRRYQDFLSYFKNNMRYIKLAERLYFEIVPCCQYESKWTDEDRDQAKRTIIFLINLYHIEKFRAIFVKSKRQWWVGKYFAVLGKELAIEEMEDPRAEIVNVLHEYFLKRNQEMKPNDDKRVDFSKIRLVSEFYIQSLFKDCYTYLSDIDQSYDQEVVRRQAKYVIQHPFL